MNTINYLNLGRLANRKVVTFLLQVIEATRLFDTESKPEYFNIYSVKVNSFYNQLKIDSTVKLTQDIVDAINKMKIDVDSIINICRGLKNSCDPEISKIANRVLEIVNKYGNYTRLGYFTRVNKMIQITEEIEGLGNEALVKICINSFVEQSKTDYERFMKIYNERTKFAASIKGSIAQTRKDAVDSYKTLVMFVNGNAGVNPEPYVNFINEVNGLIIKANQMITKSKDKTEINGSKPEFSDCELQEEVNA
ncbi:MAG: DUF6261 family protein [Bacteroidales bacterium]|nr:DUF6261 family protein [Bacteroidales bacterium]